MLLLDRNRLTPNHMHWTLYSLWANGFGTHNNRQYLNYSSNKWAWYENGTSSCQLFSLYGGWQVTLLELCYLSFCCDRTAQWSGSWNTATWLNGKWCKALHIWQGAGSLESRLKFLHHWYNGLVRAPQCHIAHVPFYAQSYFCSKFHCNSIQQTTMWT